MANELITVGYKGLEVQVKGAVIKDRISSALGKPADSPDVKKFITGAMIYIANNDELKKCTVDSIIDCLIECAAVKMPVDNRKLMHLIRRGNKCTAMPDYTGYIYKMKEADPKLEIQFGLVRKNDKFEHGKRSGTAFYEHKVANSFATGYLDVIGGYCFTKGSGGSDITVLSRTDIEAARAKATTQVIWSAWPVAMAIKTVIRSHCKIKYKEALGGLDAMDNQFFNMKGGEPQKVMIAETVEMPPENILTAPAEAAQVEVTMAETPLEPTPSSTDIDAPHEAVNPTEQTAGPEPRQNEPIISLAQGKRFYAIAKNQGKKTDAEIKDFMASIGVNRTSEMPISYYEEACKWASGENK